MEGRMLQDWINVNAGGSGITVVQGQPFWLDVSPFRDAIVWLDVQNADAPTGLPSASIQIAYETAPTEDEILFTQLTAPITLVANTVTVTQLLGSIQGVPLAKWFRWKLSITAANSNPWSTTFRVLLALNRPGYRTPTYMVRPIAKPALGPEQGQGIQKLGISDVPIYRLNK